MSSEPHLFVIFGATGDLTSRKLVPALYKLLLSKDDGQSVILGVGRSELTDEAFRATIREALQESGCDKKHATNWCAGSVHYQQVTDEDYSQLRRRIENVENERGLTGNRVFYLALPPSAFEPVISALGEHELATSRGWTRLVIEKPFGHDLASARALNALVHRYFDEAQVFRIDHYLGKETVQNLLVFRFANTVFESLWNRDRIEEVEITVAEQLDVANRAGYYDGAGALRDMIQNHITQLLTLVAMEAPAKWNAEAVRNEKVKVLQAIAPVELDHVVYGQYEAAGEVDSYSNHDGVAAESTTPTYVAMRIHVDNWRWQGVPFHLRTGKALPERTTQVTVTFRRPPVSFFSDLATEAFDRDVLVLTLQPDEGFDLCIDVKHPGDTMDIDKIPLSFDYADRFGVVADAYETLLADIIEGDQTLFVRADEVESSWEVFQPVLDSEFSPEPYAAGTWGPAAADEIAVTGWKTGASNCSED
ncbi:MAG: glucose-6-phosphate dehydrogenase [Acidimicrobiia bacterium]|nr:glucose-6-phosphate dehydrogenase [Acidimicrobiia bacterium]